VSYPTSSQIFKEPLDRITDVIGRVSLDTYYQVTFSFGKYSTWLSASPQVATSGARTSQGLDWMRKMSLLCTNAEIPGTSYLTSSVQGDRQGISEKFPNFRQFPDLNLTFNVDADHVIIKVLETWMRYINPIVTGNNRTYNAYTKFQYPDTYKEILHITKFEKDFGRESTRGASASGQTTGTLTYEFVNVWPVNMTSMPVRYGDSDILKCSIQFAYDRYHTSFIDSSAGINPTPINTPEVKSDDIIKSNPIPLETVPFFNTDKFSKVITNEYYNNGIIRGANPSQQTQGPGQRSQDATNFGRGIA